MFVKMRINLFIYFYSTLLCSYTVVCQSEPYRPYMEDGEGSGYIEEFEGSGFGTLNTGSHNPYKPSRGHSSRPIDDDDNDDYDEFDVEYEGSAAGPHYDSDIVIDGSNIHSPPYDDTYGDVDDTEGEIINQPDNYDGVNNSEEEINIDEPEDNHKEYIPVDENVIIPKNKKPVQEAPPAAPPVQPSSTKPPPTLTDDDDDNDTMDSSVTILTQKGNDRQVSVFAQPGILAAFIGGAVVGLLCAILFVMFIVYRMRKKDEGSYPLDEPKRMPLTASYSPNDKEIYA